MNTFDDAIGQIQRTREMLAGITKSAFQPGAGPQPPPQQAGPPPGAPPDPNAPPPMPSGGPPVDPTAGANPAQPPQIDPQQIMEMLQQVQALSGGLQQLAQTFSAKMQEFDQLKQQVMQSAQKEMVIEHRLGQLESSINQPAPFDPGMDPSAGGAPDPMQQGGGGQGVIQQGMQ